jgi:hypothetical protein
MLMKKTVSVSFLLAVTPKHLNAIITKDNIQPVSQITDKVCHVQYWFLFPYMQ